MKQYKVTDNPNLVRDRHSKAILKTSIAELQEHRQKKQTTQSINELNREINNIKGDIQDIKNMLFALLKK